MRSTIAAAFAVAEHLARGFPDARSVRIDVAAPAVKSSASFFAGRSFARRQEWIPVTCPDLLLGFSRALSRSARNKPILPLIPMRLFCFSGGGEG